MTEARVSARGSGVLLHPTSLPGPGIGDLGETARSFVDWLAEAGQTHWQILPLVPVDEGGSPYNGLSALAGNPLLVSPASLLADGLLEEADLAASPALPAARVDFPTVARWKDGLFALAHRRFQEGAADHLGAEFDAFREANPGWLPDYAHFRALRERHRQAPWTAWPRELRRRDPDALAASRAELRDEIERFAFQQFLFERQWRRLRRYANGRGIRIIGDLPIFVAHDSADVWAHPGLFRLDADGAPEVVSGVPPDYFSATGQRWGNPLYRWDEMRRTGYAWWVERFRRTFALVDVVRVDHFRGFEAYWEIPADEPTAVRGRWVEGPGAGFFRALEDRLGPLPVIAEDLGLITEAVDRLREELGFPGMRVLQFAFDGDPDNPHLPDNYPERCVAYTGTHDNDTLLGWWRALPREERQRASAWLDAIDPSPWDFIEAVLSSRAELAVVPLQDLLELGAAARMNTPGEAARNWTWRIESLPPDHIAHHLLDVCRRSGRGAKHES